MQNCSGVKDNNTFAAVHGHSSMKVRYPIGFKAICRQFDTKKLEMTAIRTDRTTAEAVTERNLKANKSQHCKSSRTDTIFIGGFW